MKRFIIWLLLSPLLLLTLIFTLNFIIDPFGITGQNLLDIKYRFARDDRTEKVERIKHIPEIDNLIFGSSRAQHLNPQVMNEQFGGYTYNFAVGGGAIEDALGLMLFLQAQKKLPKNVLLTLDFATFNDHIPSASSFYKLRELNFEAYSDYRPDYLYKFLSIAAIRASFKTIKAHLKNDIPNSYNAPDGMKKSTGKNPNFFKTGNSKVIQSMAHAYYNNHYSSGRYELSARRMNYLASFVELCGQNNINLFVALTPVHTYQLDLIENDTQLAHKLKRFKNKIAEITPYCDAMIPSAYTKDETYFADSVHYSDELGSLFMEAIFSRELQALCLPIPKL